MNRFVRVALAAAILPAAYLAGGPAAAQSDPIMEQNGIRYACTGIAESANDPRWARFPLKLVFATEPVGALLSNVQAPSWRPVAASSCRLIAPTVPG